MAMISQSLETTLHKAFVDARTKRHEIIGVEHLLLSLISDETARPVFIALNANIEELARDVGNFLEQNIPVRDGTGEVDTQPTLGFQRVVQRAIMHVQSIGASDGIVDGASCLLAIFGEKDSHAVYYLHTQGVTRLDVANYIFGTRPKEPNRESAELRLVEQPQDSLDAAIEKAAKTLTNTKEAGPAGLRVFISYSHFDSKYLDRLLVHLKPLERKKLLDPWSDKKIRTGDKWQAEIDENLQNSAIAVLLISADFLASDFIINNELPPLLLKAEAKGLRVLPVIVKPCGFLRDNVLRSFQAANDPSKPLLGMTEIEQEYLYDQIASEIHNEILLRSESLRN